MLTEKEIQVIQLKQKGMLQQEIAKKLNISQPAVSAFLANAQFKIKDAQETIQVAKKMGVGTSEK